jgi:hypothetical protein
MGRWMTMLGLWVGTSLVAGCSSSSQTAEDPTCDSEPIVRTTPGGVECTSSERFGEEGMFVKRRFMVLA